MGNFSYICKGCGYELHYGEQVRLAGCKGEYDGYGGAGNFSDEGYEEFPAWHEHCYQKATPEEKLDETPSKHAPNQGFGYPLAFVCARPTVKYFVRAEKRIDLKDYNEYVLNRHGFMTYTYETSEILDEGDEGAKTWIRMSMPENVAEEMIKLLDEKNKLLDNIDFSADFKNHKDWDRVEELSKKVHPATPMYFDTKEDAEKAALDLGNEWGYIYLLGVDEKEELTGVVSAYREAEIT